MLKRINIIQFLPYYPPHKGGLETVGEEMGQYWSKSNFGEFINIVTEFEQQKELELNEKIIFEGEIVGYKKGGCEIIIVPSIEIINNFPVYKILDKKYKLINKYLKEKIGEDKDNFRIITHTRFFLTSLIGGLFAKNNKIKWIHVEHGSDYVKLTSKLKTFVAYIYDKVIGKWIFKKAEKVLAISEICKDFINKELVDREVEIFYRGLRLPKDIEIKDDLKEKFFGKIIVGYVGRLYKWKNVESLIKAYYLFNNKAIQLVIVGDGEDFDRLKLLDRENRVYFTGGKSFEEALSYQKQFDIHVHPSSPGGGLATTLLQAMNFGCMIVATPNEGAKEVIENNKNGFLLKDDSIKELKRGIKLGVKKLGKKEEFSLENKKIINEKFMWDNNILKLYNLVK